MQAVHEMHMSGFCHADLKNSNAMVTHSEGTVTVRLIDMACSQQQKPGMQIVCLAQDWQCSMCLRHGMNHAGLVLRVMQALRETDTYSLAGMTVLDVALWTAFKANFYSEVHAMLQARSLVFAHL